MSRCKGAKDKRKRNKRATPGHTNRKHDRTTVKCDFCGSGIEKAIPHKTNFCNRKCKGFWMSQHPGPRTGKKKRMRIPKFFKYCKCDCGQIICKPSYLGKLPDYLPGHNAKVDNSRNNLIPFKKGCTPWNKDKKGVQEAWNKNLTKETDERVMKCALFKRDKWRQDPEYAKKMYLSWQHKPNKPEILLTNLIQMIRPWDFIYSGDGKIVVGGKCPDWFNVNSKKQVIEHFGNYHHGEEKTGRTKEQEEKQRMDHFKKYGYDCLIIWQSELKNLDKVIEKIKNF